METKNVFKIILALPVALLTLAGCSNDSSNSTTSTTSSYQCYTASGTAVTNSYCSDGNNYYCLSGTTQVANSYCTSGTTSSTAYQCYDTSGNSVSNSYCSDTSNYLCKYGTSQVANSYCYSGSGSTTTVNQCTGWYYFGGGYVGNIYYQPGQYYCYANTASSNNCSGVRMTSLNGSNYGQTLTCP